MGRAMVMTENTRETILSKLRKAPHKGVPARNPQPVQVDPEIDRPALIDLLKEKLTLVGCRVFEAQGRKAVRGILTDLFHQEGISRILASEDEVITSLNLRDWAGEQGFELKSLSDFETPRDYKEAVFLEAEAGLTGVDFAAASTGSLVLAAGPRQARLVSLAPISHFAIVPLSRVVPDHQSVVERIFGQGERPSQVFWITGPSRTGDIEAIINLGMHGPKNVFVILLDDSTG